MNAEEIDKQKQNKKKQFKSNALWSPLLALAWRDFQKNNDCKTIVSGSSTTAKTFLKDLEALQCDPQDFEGTVFYKGGVRPQTALAISKYISEFNERKDCVFSLQKVGLIKHDQAIFYASLWRNVKLQYPFYKTYNKIMHFCKIKVPCFEPINLKQREQVQIIKFNNDQNFFLRIRTAVAGEYMYLLMSKIPKSQKQVFDLINQVREKKIELMTNCDIFKIPQISISWQKKHQQISGVKIQLSNEPKPFQIAQMIECGSFCLEGQNQKDYDDLSMTVPQEETPKLKQRRMCLNNPFWIVMKKKGRKPYFSVFLNNPNEKL